MTERECRSTSHIFQLPLFPSLFLDLLYGPGVLSLYFSLAVCVVTVKAVIRHPHLLLEQSLAPPTSSSASFSKLARDQSSLSQFFQSTDPDLPTGIANNFFIARQWLFFRFVPVKALFTVSVGYIIIQQIQCFSQPVLSCYCIRLHCSRS